MFLLVIGIDAVDAYKFHSISFPKSEDIAGGRRIAMSLNDLFVFLKEGVISILIFFFIL